MLSLALLFVLGVGLPDLGKLDGAHLARPATSPDESQRLIVEAFACINNVDVIAVFHMTLAGAEFGVRSSIVPLDHTLALSPLISSADPRGRGNPSKHTKVACHIFLAQGAHCFRRLYSGRRRYTQ